MSGSLAAYTTFGIGGSAREIVFADSAEKLTELAQSGALVLGGGSNVLVSDSGYAGTVAINRYDGMTVSGVVVVGSGMRLSAFANRLSALGLSGMEWSVGIPGTVGGAVRMNAGAFGACVSDRLVYADVARRGEIVRLNKSELGFGYRQSALEKSDVVIAAAFETTADDPLYIRRRMNEFSQKRAAAQPIGKSAGSVFKNPPGIHIAELIEKAGLKGYSVGGAKISERHANIIVNTGNASAKDVRSIIERVKTELLSRYGVAAKEEIVYIGEFF